MASLLADVACEREAEFIWSSEREASRLDTESSDAAVEDRGWEAALADGLD